MSIWNVPDSMEKIFKLRCLLGNSVYTEAIMSQILELMYSEDLVKELPHYFINGQYREIKKLLQHYIKELVLRY